MTKLFELMKEKNISAKQLSLDTGISTGNISDWKSGRSKPSAAKLQILANYFSVSVDYLIGNNTPSANLSPKQQELLDMYNALTPEQQTLAEQLLRQMTNNKENS